MSTLLLPNISSGSGCAPSLAPAPWTLLRGQHLDGGDGGEDHLGQVGARQRHGRARGHHDQRARLVHAPLLRVHLRRAGLCSVARR